ncbi:MAG TPA: phosphatidylglycerol lysyltransferase domain-containing protein [Clostridia bacterium]|nr:phosphatidylglycerol lysyltransferase domain-containing protein [Clostridia bacterium]
MDFKRLQLKDIETFRPYLKKMKVNTCDYTVGGIFMWRDFFHMEYCLEDDVLYSRLLTADGDFYNNLPLCGDVDTALKRLISHIKEQDKPCRFCTIPQSYVHHFEKLGSSLGYSVEIYEQENFFDYLYLASDLTTLKGKKFSGQRNQISKFLRSYGDWSYDTIAPKDIGDIKAFFNAYMEERSESNAFASALEENRMTHEVLENLESYKMLGGVLRVGSKIAGFSLGEIVDNTLFVHVEKADRSFAGAYQMLVNQFALKFSDENIQFINREEDMGDEGLRIAKNAYHPVQLIKKYLVEIR